MTNIDTDFFTKIAQNLCTLTDGNWKPVVDQHGNTSIDETRSGLSLWFRIGGYGNEGKITISYDRPRDSKGGYVEVYHPMGGAQIGNPSIRVSASKTPEVIAKDIVRRMLDAAKNVHALVTKQIKDTDNYYNKKRLLALDLADICHAKVNNPDSDMPTINPYESIKGYLGDVRMGYGTVTVGSDYATIKLDSIPAELAKKLTEAIVYTLKNHSNRII